MMQPVTGRLRVSLSEAVFESQEQKAADEIGRLLAPLSKDEAERVMALVFLRLRGR